MSKVPFDGTLIKQLCISSKLNLASHSCILRTYYTQIEIYILLLIKILISLHVMFKCNTVNILIYMQLY